jgi:GH15 family glucan-1,4-alpha-glucosidase
MLQEGGVLFHSKDLHLALASPFSLTKHKSGGVRAKFTLHAGQAAHFLLKSMKANNHVLSPLKTDEYQERLQHTLNYWRRWISYSRYRGRWREYVQRAALALKLLTYQPTGAIVAAPTTSLPEGIGEARNWDYRYTWLRDASFTLSSLLSLSFNQEAEAFMNWLDARCHELKGDGSLQPIYGIHGQHDLKETTLPHLEGYRQSKPVRIGNRAAQQKQLGVCGELMDAVYISNQYAAISYNLWEDLLRYPYPGQPARMTSSLPVDHNIPYSITANRSPKGIRKASCFVAEPRILAAEANHATIAHMIASQPPMIINATLPIAS